MAKDIVKIDELANAVAKESGSTKAQARKMVEVFNSMLPEWLINGRVFRIPKVGTLSVVKRKATTYRNPKTKKIVQQGEVLRLKFSTSNVIKEELKKKS